MPMTEDHRRISRRHMLTKAGDDTYCGSRWGPVEVDPLLTTCPDCLLLGSSEGDAHDARRAELDRELRAMGARVIRVRDLGAALEARERGGIAIQVVTGPGWQPMPFAPTIAIRAAHLARVALGEVES